MMVECSNEMIGEKVWDNFHYRTDDRVLPKVIWDVLERLVEKRKNTTIDRERQRKIVWQIEFKVNKLEVLGLNS